VGRACDVWLWRFILAVLIAAIAVLIAGNIVVWTVVGLKSIDRSFSVGFRRGMGRERPPD